MPTASACASATQRCTPPAKHQDLYVEWFATDLTSVFGGSAQVGWQPLDIALWTGPATYCQDLSSREPFLQRPVLLSTAGRKGGFAVPEGFGGRPNGPAVVLG